MVWSVWWRWCCRRFGRWLFERRCCRAGGRFFYGGADGSVDGSFDGGADCVTVGLVDGANDRSFVGVALGLMVRLTLPVGLSD